jgi:hypothetical protein
MNQQTALASRKITTFASAHPELRNGVVKCLTAG